MGSRIAHTSAERLGSVSGGSRERDTSRVRDARRVYDRARDLRKGRAGQARTATKRQGQWTVASRRLAARSRVNRVSCQGVCWLSRVSPCT